MCLWRCVCAGRRVTLTQDCGQDHRGVKSVQDGCVRVRPELVSTCGGGRALGVPFDAGEMDIDIGPHVLMTRGQPLEFDAAAASAYLKEKANAPAERYLTEDDTVVVEVGLGKGPGNGVVRGCDLSCKCVEINAECMT